MLVFYTSASCQEEAGVNSPRTARCNPDPRADRRCVFSSPSAGEDVRQVIYESRRFLFFFSKLNFFSLFFFGTWLRAAPFHLTTRRSRPNNRVSGDPLLVFCRDKPSRLGTFITICSFGTKGADGCDGHWWDEALELWSHFSPSATLNT